MSPRPIAVLVGLGVLAVAMVGVARLTGDDDEVLALGEEAVVSYAETTRTGQPGARTTLGVTVLRVRRGTQDELRQGGLEVDEEARDATPYYVDARFTNRGQNAIKRGLSIGLEDSDGNSLPTTLIFGLGGAPYEPCERVSEGTLAPGESYESCTLVLVPEGRDVDKVVFVSQEASAEIILTYWKAG